MKTTELNRRQFLKTTGALIVGFNLFPTPSVLAQSMVEPATEADPTQLDSWLAIATDGTVTVYSGKVDLGTGVETALAQIVAEDWMCLSTKSTCSVWIHPKRLTKE